MWWSVCGAAGSVCCHQLVASVRAFALSFLGVFHFCFFFSNFHLRARACPSSSHGPAFFSRTDIFAAVVEYFAPVSFFGRRRVFRAHVVRAVRVCTARVSFVYAYACGARKTVESRSHTSRSEHTGLPMRVVRV